MAHDPLVRDIRLAPFCWQEKRCLRLIRQRFQKQERMTAFAVYLILTEAVSDENNSVECAKSRRDLAERLGGSVDTIDKYVKAFEEMGLLQVEERREGLVQLPNLISLTSPFDQTEAEPRPRRSQAAGQRSPAASLGRGAAHTIRIEKQEKEKGDIQIKTKARKPKGTDPDAYFRGEFAHLIRA